MVAASVGVRTPALSQQAPLKPAVIHVEDVLKMGLTQRVIPAERQATVARAVGYTARKPHTR